MESTSLSDVCAFIEHKKRLTSLLPCITVKCSAPKFQVDQALNGIKEKDIVPGKPEFNVGILKKFEYEIDELPDEVTKEALTYVLSEYRYG